MTGGGAEINFGGPREVYLCEFEGGTGSLLECGTNKKGEDQKKKKKGLQYKNFNKF